MAIVHTVPTLFTDAKKVSTTVDMVSIVSDRSLRAFYVLERIGMKNDSWSDGRKLLATGIENERGFSKGNDRFRWTEMPDDESQSKKWKPERNALLERKGVDILYVVIYGRTRSPKELWRSKESLVSLFSRFGTHVVGGCSSHSPTTSQIDDQWLFHKCKNRFSMT